MQQSITLAEMELETSQLAAQLADKNALRPALKSAELMMVSAVKDNFNKGVDPNGTPWKPLAHPRPAGGDKPLRDRGLLMASFSARSNPDGVTVGSSSPQAGLMQWGGIIRATNKKWLTIPLTKAASRVSAPRFPGKLHAVISEVIGTGVLIDQTGVAQYALRKFVVVPERPMVGFGAKLLDRLSKMFSEFMTKLLARERQGGHDAGN